MSDSLTTGVLVLTSCALQSTSSTNGPVKGTVGSGTPTEILKTAKRSTERATFSKEEVDGSAASGATTQLSRFSYITSMIMNRAQKQRKPSHKEILLRTCYPSVHTLHEFMLRLADKAAIT